MNKKIFSRADALLSLVGDYGWSMTEDTVTYAADSPSTPSMKALDAEVLRLEAQAAATQYQRDRAAEYAKLNQDELRFDDMMNGTTVWKDTILAIKAKYPKVAGVK